MIPFLFACGAPDLTAEVQRLEAEVASLAAENAKLQQQLAERVEPAAPLDQEPGSWSPEQLCTRDADGIYRFGPGLLGGEVWGAGRLLLHRGEDGAFDGYRLSAIRRGSPGETCGFANGDVVHTVNQNRLDSMEAAMIAFSELQSAPELTVTLTRDGAPVELKFRPN